MYRISQGKNNSTWIIKVSHSQFTETNTIQLLIKIILPGTRLQITPVQCINGIPALGYHGKSNGLKNGKPGAGLPHRTTPLCSWVNPNNTSGCAFPTPQFPDSPVLAARVLLKSDFTSSPWLHQYIPQHNWLHHKILQNGFNEIL